MGDCVKKEGSVDAARDGTSSSEIPEGKTDVPEIKSIKFFPRRVTARKGIGNSRSKLKTLKAIRRLFFKTSSGPVQIP